MGLLLIGQYLGSSDKVLFVYSRCLIIGVYFSIEGFFRCGEIEKVLSLLLF